MDGIDRIDRLFPPFRERDPFDRRQYCRTFRNSYLVSIHKGWALVWHRDVPTKSTTYVVDFGRNEETAFSRSDSINSQEGCLWMTTI